MTGPPPATDFRLDGKVALVTGAGQGLGAAIALRLAAAGAAVGVNDVDADAADAVVAAIARAGGSGVALCADVADADAVSTMFARLDSDLGRVNILVNNAGIVMGETIDAVDPSNWDRVLAVNLTGPMLCSREAMARMRIAGGGRIVMLGSMVGQQGALRGWVAYGTTKAGLHGLARTLARDGARHAITVNVVAPGVIDTTLLRQSHGTDGVASLAAAVPLQRLGHVDDVAAAVQFLASDAAAYITGVTLDVNGGMYVRA